MPRPPHRFHYPGAIPTPDADGNSAAAPTIIDIPREESRHMQRVLRLRTGSRVDVFDAAGRAFAAELLPGERNAARLQILHPLDPAPGADPTAPHAAGLPTPPLHLAVAVIKRRGMELMIEKLSELGVATLQPLLTRRTVAATSHAAGSPDADLPERWERLALAAAKQCGRNLPLAILAPQPVAAWLAALQADPTARAAYGDLTEHSVTLGQWLRQLPPGAAAPLHIAVGPEGGWTPEETQALAAAGLQPVTLGPLTLRAETAALAAAAAVRLL
jgi:16S rRNA (uracil1498-N3)-methyltransferase